MKTEYKATAYVQSGLIGHAFLKLEAPGQSPIVVGYYPVEHSPQAPGTLRNDAVSGISLRGSQSATPDSAARWQESVRQNMKAAWNTITDNPDLFKEQDLAELAHGMAQRDGPGVARDETTGDNQDTAIDKLTQDALAA